MRLKTNHMLFPIRECSLAQPISDKVFPCPCRLSVALELYPPLCATIAWPQWSNRRIFWETQLRTRRFLADSPIPFENLITPVHAEPLLKIPKLCKKATRFHIRIRGALPVSVP